MSHKQASSARYASDLSDEQWAIVEPLLPKEKWGRPIEIDMRSAVNGRFYMARTGCQWDNLPHEYPNHNSVYYPCTITITSGVGTGPGNASTRRCVSRYGKPSVERLSPARRLSTVKA